MRSTRRIGIHFQEQLDESGQLARDIKETARDSKAEHMCHLGAAVNSAMWMLSEFWRSRQHMDNESDPYFQTKR